MVNEKLNIFLKDFYGFEIIIFLLSFTFCIIPKAIKKFDKLFKIFPILTLSSAGFLLAVLLLDFIPHMFHHDHNSGSQTVNTHNHSHHNHSNTPTRECCNYSHANDDHNKSHVNTIVGMICAGVSLLCLVAIDQCVIKHDHCEDNKEEHCHSKDKEIKEGLQQTIDVDTNVKIPACPDDDKDIGCCNTKMLKKTESKTKALIYIFSISIHSFFEGLGMKQSGLGTYEFGIILHKVLESFAIGMTLFNSAFSLPVCLMMNAFYSILTPLGMFISRHASGDGYFIYGVPISYLFNGLALGSLMFIVFLEMIPGAFHKKGNKTHKMLGLMVGFVLSSILIVLTPHEH